MNKKSAVLLTMLLSMGTSVAMAADTPSNPPPAQKQMNTPPDSTSSGNYLETQPNDNGDKTDGKKNAKPTNVEKGKSHKEKPQSGGVNVDSK